LVIVKSLDQFDAKSCLIVKTKRFCVLSIQKQQINAKSLPVDKEKLMKWQW